MRDLSERVTSGEESGLLHEELERLLPYFPVDEVGAAQFHNYVTYLLSYHYERAGRDSEAVAIYIDLIEQAPHSPWSLLAWARLEPVVE